MQAEIQSPHERWMRLLSSWLLTLSIAMLGVAGVLLVLYQGGVLTSDDYLEKLSPDATCELHLETCQLETEQGGIVHLSVTPKEIPTSSPITYHVKTDHLDVSRVKVEIVGVTMNMGSHEIYLTKNDEGVFEGSGILPVCVRSSMHWEARIHLLTKEGWILAPYQFWTFYI